MLYLFFDIVVAQGADGGKAIVKKPVQLALRLLSGMLPEATIHDVDKRLGTLVA